MQRTFLKNKISPILQSQCLCYKPVPIRERKYTEIKYNEAIIVDIRGRVLNIIGAILFKMRIERTKSNK